MGNETPSPSKELKTNPTAQNAASTVTPEKTKSLKLPIFIVLAIIVVVLLLLCVILLAVGIVAINPAGKIEVTPTLTPTLKVSAEETKAYTTADGSFSIMYNTDKVENIEERERESEKPIVDNPGSYSELLIFLENGEHLLTIAYHDSSETIDMPIYGGGGNLIPSGKINFLGSSLENYAEQYQGRTSGYFYNRANEIIRDELTFAISLTQTDFFTQDSITNDVLTEANTILESLATTQANSFENWENFEYELLDGTKISGIAPRGHTFETDFTEFNITNPLGSGFSILDLGESEEDSLGLNVYFSEGIYHFYPVDIYLISDFGLNLYRYKSKESDPFLNYFGYTDSYISEKEVCSELVSPHLDVKLPGEETIKRSTVCGTGTFQEIFTVVCESGKSRENALEECDELVKILEIMRPT